MNKKLLTAAIAAVIAAPTVALANDVTVYGAAHVSIDYRNEDDASARAWVFDRASNSFVPALFNSDTGGFVSISGLDPIDQQVLLFDAQQALYNNFPGSRTDGFDVASRATRLGFKGTEDLANGLKAIWKMEFQVDIADRGGTCAANTAIDNINSLGSPTLNQGNVNGACDNGQLVTARNAYVGLAGGWGTFLVGRHDTPYKMSTGKLDLFADTLADYNSTIGFVDLRSNSAIAYVSPSWSGFSFAGALVAPHVANDNSYQIPVVDANFNVTGVETIRKSADADSLAEAYSLALSYDNAGFLATVAYENVSGDWWDAWTNGGLSPLRAYNLAYDSPWVGDTINGLGTNFYASDDNSKWRVGLGWTGAGFTVGGLYEWEDNLLGVKNSDGERWQLQAGYTFGNTMVKAMYGEGDFSWSGSASRVNYLIDPAGGADPIVVTQNRRISQEADQSAWAIGVDHSLSKRTKAYILYTAVDGDRSQTVENTQSNVVGLQGTSNKTKVDYNTGGFSIGMIHTF